ncbi:MAG: Shedu anti-phage system protein SduA domain-containing protein [Pseudomonadota bacterium]
MTQGHLPPGQTINDVVVRIKQTFTNPNVRSITQVVLKEGPRAFKIATLLEVINPNTGEFHHYSLRIDHVDKNKAGWFAKPEKSVRLEGKEPDEIGKLYQFLKAVYEKTLVGESGELHLVRGEDYAKLEQLLTALPNLPSTDKLHLFQSLLSEIEGTDSSVEEFATAFESGDEDAVRNIAAASRLIGYRKALTELKNLIDDPETSEATLQKHLEKNPWMFGSEYSELLPRKTWTRDDRLDYMLRRTVDNYLEIVEIKTAFRERLFIHDEARDCFYPSSKLSPVIGQVTRYIEEVERNRDAILAKDKVDTLKIRARAIVGRDNPDEQAPLRNLNAHLHRIEIITFDQLIRIAERVLAIFSVGHDAIPKDDVAPFDDDIPF